ncbi:MAG TPA: hypothetical protein VGG66_05600 [Rhizomicrobium sp.]|jgi:hypothetical protein
MFLPGQARGKGAVVHAGLNVDRRRDLARLTILATPARGCEACQCQRLHTQAERRAYHPWTGHGFSGSGWSHPDLDPAKGVPR